VSFTTAMPCPLRKSTLKHGRSLVLVFVSLGCFEAASAQEPRSEHKQIPIKTAASEFLQLTSGTPRQYRDRYIDNSPSFFFDRIETPSLIG
jgi:hypothetical protein